MVMAYLIHGIIVLRNPVPVRLMAVRHFQLLRLLQL